MRTFWWSPPVVLTAAVVLALTGWACSSGATDMAPDTDAPAPATDVGQPDSAEVSGQAPRPKEGSPSVIILEPHIPSDVPVPDEPATMDQFGRDFIPRLLLSRVGQTVQFKNSEDDLHTVHVRDDEGNSLFNVAMPIRGGTHVHRFDEAGDYPVSCEAHQEMHATILVVTTPFAVIADREGRFAFQTMPAGSYDLILRRGPERHEQVIEIVRGRNELVLDFPSDTD